MLFTINIVDPTYTIPYLHIYLHISGLAFQITEFIIELLLNNLLYTGVTYWLANRSLII